MLSTMRRMSENVRLLFLHSGTHARTHTHTYIPKHHSATSYFSKLLRDMQHLMMPAGLVI